MTFLILFFFRHFNINNLNIPDNNYDNIFNMLRYLEEDKSFVNISLNKKCFITSGSGFWVPEMPHPLRYGANILKTCGSSRDNIGGVR